MKQCEFIAHQANGANKIGINEEKYLKRLHFKP